MVPARVESEKRAEPVQNPAAAKAGALSGEGQSHQTFLDKFVDIGRVIAGKKGQDYSSAADSKRQTSISEFFEPSTGHPAATLAPLAPTRTGT